MVFTICFPRSVSCWVFGCEVVVVSVGLDDPGLHGISVEWYSSLGTAGIDEACYAVVFNLWTCPSSSCSWFSLSALFSWLWRRVHFLCRCWHVSLLFSSSSCPAEDLLSLSHFGPIDGGTQNLLFTLSSHAGPSSPAVATSSRTGLHTSLASCEVWEFDVLAVQIIFFWLEGMPEMTWVHLQRCWWSCVGEELSDFVHGGVLARFSA